VIGSDALSPESLVSLGTAAVVMGAAIKGTMVLVNIRRDLDDIRSGILRRNEFELWSARLARNNPDLKVPDLEDKPA